MAKIWKTLWLGMPILIGFVSFGGYAAEITEPAKEAGAIALEVGRSVIEAHETPIRPLPRRLVISIADRKLALLEGGEVRRTWDVAVGKESTPSPVGSFQIATRVVNPTWYGRLQTIPPGPKNPVGTRWIGLSKKGYGIHGTNAPDSIGTAASKGCIRMHKDDVEELYELVAEGDEVELVPSPTGDLIAVFAPTIRPQRSNEELEQARDDGPVLVAKARR